MLPHFPDFFYFIHVKSISDQVKFDSNQRRIVGTHCYFACLLASCDPMISSPVNLSFILFILTLPFY